MDAPPPVLTVRTLTALLDMTVPATPPHLKASVIPVVLEKVPYAPVSVRRKARPSCRKLAGIVTFGKRIVSVVLEAIAVPLAVAQASVSDQNCLLIALPFLSAYVFIIAPKLSQPSIWSIVVSFQSCTVD